MKWSSLPEVLAGRSASSTCLNNAWYINNLGISDETCAGIPSYLLQVFPCLSVSSVSISRYLPADNTVTDSFHRSGNFSTVWNWNDANRDRAKNYVCFCRFESGSITETKQIILV
jgi:hypothetical protein